MPHLIRILAAHWLPSPTAGVVRGALVVHYGGATTKGDEVPDDKRDEERERGPDDDADELEIEDPLEAERPGYGEPDPPLADV